MRVARYPIVASVLAGTVLALGLGAATHSRAIAETPHVVISDDQGSFRPDDPANIAWGFSPSPLEVVQGDQIVFDSPATNRFPHNVTSIKQVRNGATLTLEVGTNFNSSPTRETQITPGSSWTLDTSTLAPGKYVYYCTLHPWVVGMFGVEAP